MGHVLVAVVLHALTALTTWALVVGLLSGWRNPNAECKNFPS